MKNYFFKFTTFLFFSFISVLFFSQVAEATIYAPGATLEPDCAPGSINCGISTPALTNIGNSNLTLTTNRLLSLDGNIMTFDGTGADFTINDDGSLQFTPINFPAHSKGLLFYNTEDKALTYYNDSAGVHINIGEDTIVRVKNSTGSTITAGSAVYISGSDGISPEISLALADSFSTSSVLGLLDEDIGDGDYGYVSTGGIIHDIDTSSFAAGDIIYLSPTIPGFFTSTPPTHPNNLVPLGYIAKQDGSDGEIYVSVKTAIRRVFTPGSIVFANASSGDLNFDNTNFFWDDVNNRLGILDNTPTATLSIGSGDLFQVFGANGNVTTQGDLTLTTGGGSVVATDGGLTLSGAGASSFSTSTGVLTLASAGSGITSTVQIGAGGAGSITPDIFALDVKSTTGDPAGFEGAMYYNTFDNRFRCYQDSAWKDCDRRVTPIALQDVYNSGGTITTAGASDVALILTSGNLTASGAGSVNLTPAGASSFTSGGALTFTGGAASTWSTSAGDLTLQSGSGTVSLGSSTNLSTDASLAINSGSGNITLQPAGSGTSAVVKIGVGGAGGITPDFLALDTFTTSAADPAGGAEGYMYYNTADNKFRCFVGAAWTDCDTTGGTTTLQTAYNAGNAISTSGTNIAFTLNTTDQFTASGAGSVNLTPTGASSFTSGGALTFTGGAASTWGTTLGDLTLQVAGTGTTARVLVGAGNGGAGSTTPDILGLDVKSDTGDPVGFNGAMYYNEFSDKFRCYENSGWKDCDTGVAAGSLTLQQAYNAGNAISTSGTNIAFTLNTTDQFTASGAGSVNLTPAGASSFTSGGALTFTGGAASTWGTTLGALTFQAAGSGTASVVQIGAGGAGSTTPDVLALDVKSDVGDPIGAEGYMYYNTLSNKFRCYVGATWADCDTAGTPTLQSVYSNGASITTASSTDLALTLTSGDFTASGAGAVNLTPTSASSFTSGGALTLTGGAASVWSTNSGSLTVDSATVLNLGTTNATSVSISKTGALTSINGSLEVADYIDFNTVSNPAHTEGRLFYDVNNHALSYYLDETTATLNIGQESYVRVKNDTGSTITNGSVVYISGSDGTTPEVSLARADATATSHALGIATHDIEDGTYGYITTFGLVRDLNTASFTPGDPIYLSEITAGAYTTTLPSQPNFTVNLGYVAKQNAITGEVLVTVADPRSGAFTLGNIPFGNSSGDLISDGTNLFWDDSTNRLGIGDNTPTATLSIGSGDLFQVFGASGNVTTAGDITLGTGGGTIASADGGLTVNSASATTLTVDSGTTGSILIGTGVAAKTITIGNAADDTFSLNSSGLNISTGGALTGVSSIDTIATSATALTFAGSGSISSTGANALTFDGGSSGVLNLNNTSTGNIIIGGGSGSTGCTLTNSTGAFACAGAITGSNITGTNAGDVTLAGTPDYITISGQVITRNKLDPADDLNTFASSVLSGLITDETGSGGVAVFGTSPTFTTDIRTPLVIGGTAVGSNIIYKSTTGAGTVTGIAHQFVGGTNGGTVAMSILNNGKVGIGVTNPNANLDIFTSDGTLRFGEAFPNKSGSTDNGISMYSEGTFKSGLFTEENGALLSYGINVSQMGDRDTAKTRAIFRMDTRATSPYFSVKRQAIGGSTRFSDIQISQAGDIGLGGWASDTNSFPGNVSILVRGAAVPGLVVRGASAQTANLTEWRNNADTILLNVTSAGSLVTSNLGVDYTDSDTNPTCAAGEYKIFADTSETKLKKCQNGVVSDLNAIPDMNSFTDSTLAAAWTDANTNELWDDATRPNITPKSTTSEILVMVTVRGTVASSGGGDTNNPVARIDREIGSTADCADTNTVGPTIGDLYLEAGGTEVFSLSTIFVDTPTTTSNVSYTVCSSSDSLGLSDTTTATRTEVTLFEVNDAADLAEIYSTNDSSIGMGDVVSLDPTLEAGVQKSSGVNDKKVVGIVSSKPAMVIGGISDEGEGAVPVALSGRVPVKVVTENGAIEPGDYLTSSSTPGVAMKSSGTGSVIGQAMSAYNGEGVGVVMVFVKNFDLGEIGETAMLLGDISPKVNADGTDNGLSTLVADIQAENSRDPIVIIGDKISNGKQFLTDFVSARVTAVRGYFDEVFAKKVHTEQICVKKSDGSEVCVSGDQLDALLNDANIDPEPIPEPAPEIIPEVTPEPAPENSPDPALEVDPETVLEATPEATPEPTPEPEPAPAPEETPAPESAPEPASEEPSL